MGGGRRKLPATSFRLPALVMGKSLPQPEPGSPTQTRVETAARAGSVCGSWKPELLQHRSSSRYRRYRCHARLGAAQIPGNSVPAGVAALLKGRSHGQCEQGDPRRQPRSRCGAAIHAGRRACRDAESRDDGSVERQRRPEAGKDRMAPYRPLGQVRRVPQRVPGQGQTDLRRGSAPDAPVGRQGWQQAVHHRDSRRQGRAPGQWRRRRGKPDTGPRRVPQPRTSQWAASPGRSSRTTISRSNRM